MAITITYLNAYDNALKSRLVFDSLSTRWKRGLFYRSLEFSTLILIFILMFYEFSQSRTEFVINGINYPLASLIRNSICFGIPISVLFGWVKFKLDIVVHNNAIAKNLEGLPAEYFGLVLVSIDYDGLTIQAPYFQCKYDWKLIHSIKVTREYLFFCSDSSYITALPIGALGTQQPEFVAKVENWISLGKETKASSA